jgi:elongation factor 1 alpha-like protein
MHKNKKESQESGKASFHFAWVLDGHAEERERGVTIDVGVTDFVTKHRRVQLLDAPGHKDFVPKMISGAAQADAAVLVVDASTGEFESGFHSGGQTVEHAILVRSLGVHQLVVAVNKLDVVAYDRARFDFIVRELSDFLKQAGYRLDDVTFVLPRRTPTLLGTMESCLQYVVDDCAARSLPRRCRSPAFRAKIL